MSMLNSKYQKDNTYDAIVIGSGISGGWAAKELTEKGLKTLVLERGRNVEHIKDYPTAVKEIWELKHRQELPPKLIKENPIVSKCYAFEEATEHFFVKDKDHPYIQKTPFYWIKGYQVGGKSLMWARMTQRWNNMDFESNIKDGNGVDWPIRYKDIAPWYSYVEKFAGIQGNRDGLPQIPDGEFLPALEMNVLEKHFKKTVETNFPGRNVVVSRSANHTERVGDRGPCMMRNRCRRGCPLSGYFSSNSATLPAAYKTGNLTLRPYSVVQSIIYDEQQGRATGVRVIDTNTKAETEYYSRIIFVNASTLNTTLLLLNSTSSRFPNGLGNDSGVLGHYLMDHNYRARIGGHHEGFKDSYFYGRKPASSYIPRFRNFGNDKQKDFVRGYSYSFWASRGAGNMAATKKTYGPEFKEKMFELGSWSAGLTGMGEHLPHFDNMVSLSKKKKDDWGMPLLEISCTYHENEEAMTKDILHAGLEMLDSAGFKDLYSSDSKQALGLGIHEMGTARMGRHPQTSILNGHNQMHAVKNVFVSDGSCMTSTACQNPSLTYMALTARAVDFAFKEVNKLNI